MERWSVMETAMSLYQERCPRRRTSPHKTFGVLKCCSFKKADMNLDRMARAPAIQENVLNFAKDRKVLFENSGTAVLIVTVYLLFIFWTGPVFMRNRKPYTLRKTLICYNFLQSALNAYVTYEAFIDIWAKWDVRCKVKDNPNFDVLVKESLIYFWHYYLLKFVDLLDTVFFVLRKKKNQITFLHVVHHAGMVLIINWGLQNFREAAASYVLICLIMNTTVHVIMYFYYGLAACGQSVRKYLWWKKYLTLVQIIFNPYMKQTTFYFLALHSSAFYFKLFNSLWRIWRRCFEHRLLSLLQTRRHDGLFAKLVHST
ncbi:Elongation of very long chain fatty acids protein 7 [Araneus ventricosus]|uniref:Elongation of very long chain fatty acids protein n=1 Tax=Araneus ventricosus TaxID=182803 RepID=A0A4Y2HG48_ARAVE|nr:Elongation of very long chain fatty acids protein 7 [Araneus ventricosus]